MKKVKIYILSLFPEIIENYFKVGVINRSHAFVDFHFFNLRDFSDNKYQSVDDYPFGGSPGMIFRPDILKNAIKSITKDHKFFSEKDDFKEFFKKYFYLIYTAPFGETWSQKQAKSLSKIIKESSDSEPETNKTLIFLCGRYEGIDQRFIDQYVHKSYNIGDYILTGGELAVASILDSTLRLLPSTLGNSDSLKEESFENNLLEGPQYTRPRLFDGIEVPKVLISGHHKNINKFHKENKILITKKHRPDLLN